MWVSIVPSICHGPSCGSLILFIIIVFIIIIIINFLRQYTSNVIACATRLLLCMREIFVCRRYVEEVFKRAADNRQGLRLGQGIETWNVRRPAKEGWAILL